jgi:NADH pyrophosphatase NudC (nudix superfamily)
MGWKFCPQCGKTLVPRSEGERERLACGACDFVHWDNPVPVVAAVIELEGKVLLARNVAWPEGRFALVTGFLERDENPRDAVAREVKEETDLDAVETSLIGVYDFALRNQVLICYHVVARGTVKLNEELAEYRLIEPARLKTWPRGTGYALADWMRSRGLTVEFMSLDARP